MHPLIIANDNALWIASRDRQGAARFDPQAFLKQCPLTIVDAQTLHIIEILSLHRALDHTMSAIGSAALLRSLLRPSTDLPYIQSRQKALREIALDDRLRQTLMDYVVEFGKGENALFKFFNKGLYALSPYADLKSARKASARLSRIEFTRRPESACLTQLIARLKDYEESPLDRMMKGSIHKTIGGLKAASEISAFTPKLTFIPRRFTRWLLAGPAIALAPMIYNSIGWGRPLSPLMSTVGMIWTGVSLFYSLFIKPVRDTGNYIEPLRARAVYDDAFSRTIDAVGAIDELLAFHQFADKLPHAVTLPQVTDKARHGFEAIGLRNPVMAQSRTDFIPNDIRMSGKRVTFITGPNSGGKTTLCKSIVHNQLLAQMGCYVVAERAVINIADMIRYQAPQFDSLRDDEGRFGAELSRTRDIFYACTPKSLVILDELAEGTTYEEGLHQSCGIMDDFYTIGNNTVLVTHNHALVEKFKAQNKGQCLMAEFKGDAPTFRITPGVSRVSHAERIARKINFSSADRRQYLIEKGYL